MRNGGRAHRLSSGSSLVEVLVSLLVLALGLLGASILQLASLRARHESALLSAGVQLAAGMAERMRANSVLMYGPDAGNPYLGWSHAAAPDGAADAAGEAGAPACFGAACGAAQLAQFDLAEWKQQLQAALPGARAHVCRDAQAWDGAAQGWHWHCSGGTGAPIVIKLGWRGRQPAGQDAVNAAGEALPKLVLQLGGGGT